MIWHWPRIYRYRVDSPGQRFMWNRYGTQTIGLALVAGRYAYCAKWAWAGDTASIPERQETP